MTRPFIEAQRLICELTGCAPESVTLQTPLRTLRATDRAAVIITCERAFHISLPDEEIIDFQTLGDLISSVEERLTDGREDFRAPTDGQREAWYYS